MTEQPATYTSDQRKFFDDMATVGWDTYNWKRRSIREAFDVEQIFKIIGPASSVLIVGCGVGSQDPIVASYETVREVHAVDPAPQCVERAEQNFSHPKIKRWVAGYADLPDSHQYDLT